MNATVKDGKLTLVLDMNATPVISKSQKSFVVASDTVSIAHNGAAMKVAVNAYTPNPDYAKPV